ncbi:hypothetical protein LOZ53_004771 [Ophidiomyces ophidiicola]|nr:hypothetical protein LOZ55_004760 [Ophidiomyces ophidiicola]KAI1979627.1 hypothetical protein LOZ54_006023 [Ophidiomyces ophidiicola]KAI1986283.1 hypothetical protein LOZ53_004771 [Ophidiomyces ophidiicola]KAI1998477.1 hypothetical protein LOZ51_002208 [Ophidiomyces ophidiicola]
MFKFSLGLETGNRGKQTYVSGRMSTTCGNILIQVCRNQNRLNHQNLRYHHLQIKKRNPYLPSNDDSIPREDTKFAIDFHSDRMEFYWKQKKAMWEILQVIRETVAPSLQYLIKRKYTARECLVVLKKHVSQHHAQIVNEIHQDLQKLYKGPQHKPITQFLLEYQGTLQEAVSYGLTEHTREAACLQDVFEEFTAQI